MKSLVIFITLSVILLSCGRAEKGIVGTYVKEPSVYTVDSLFIYADSLQPTKVHNRKVYKYKQVFYNKKTTKLLFENNGTWWLDDGKIELMHFYFDADNNPDNYSYAKEAIENAVTLFSTAKDGENIIVEKGVFYKKVN